MPGFCRKAIENALSNERVMVSCDSLAFGFRHGIRVRGLKVFDLATTNSVMPVMAAKSVSVSFLSRLVQVKDLRYPRLPDAYYRGECDAGRKATADADDDEFQFPELPGFHLELIRPEVLGIVASRVRAEVRCEPGKLEFSGIRLDWPERGRPMALDGACVIDLDGGHVTGHVTGLATQAQIRPLIVALDFPVALPYMDAFTGVTEPVPSYCGWDYGLETGTFKMKLDLKPTLGSYNGVPMRKADGGIGLDVGVVDGQSRFDTRVGPLTAWDRQGRTLSGELHVRGSNDLCRIHFDAESRLDKAALLSVMDMLNDGTLDCVRCVTAPTVTAKGVLATDVADQAANDLHGRVEFANGTFFGAELRNVGFDYGYVGSAIHFTDLAAAGARGGRLTGAARIDVPMLDPDRARFAFDMKYRDGSIAELADWFKTDPGDRSGKVEGELHLSGAIATNLCGTLNGNGSIRSKDGKLSQMRLFAGLTDLLADKIPGVAAIVNQSDGRCTFTIRDGVFGTDDLVIEGGLFSIKMAGTYDLVKDALNFTVRAQFLRDDSLLGKYLIQPVTWTFSKLLMEFRVKGTLDNPDWRYISVIDRVLGGE